MLKYINKKDNLHRYYTIGDIFELGFAIICSKIIDWRIRIIRRPFILRGRKYIDFGRNLTTGYWCRFEVFPQDNDKRIRLKFGDNIQLNDFVHISAMNCVEIGNCCLIASHVYISDNSHGIYSGNEHKHSSPLTSPDHRQYTTSPVKIGNNCWLGEGVIVLPGVTIGDGCVIGAHSVVNKDIPAYSIAVGSPIRIVKQYCFENSCWERVK